MRVLTLIAATLVSAFVLAGSAAAVPTTVSHVDSPMCDTLSIPGSVDELGVGALFPADEKITAFASLTGVEPCATNSPTALPNILLEITNLTPFDFEEVWYVGDPATVFVNFDGFADGPSGACSDCLAVRIDSVISDPFGVNHPLVFESLIPNDIFESGETWAFVLEDYADFGPTFFPGGLASELGSTGVGGDSLVGSLDGSTGSIIATVVPEPSTALLLGGGLLGLAVRGRQRKA